MLISPEECFQVWAPDSSVWSQWAKPVLFTQLDRVPADAALPGDWRNLDVSWSPRPDEHTALVLDLPGGESVLAGLALAKRGFRPVPLFNAVTDPAAVVNVVPLLIGLACGAAELRLIAIPDDAPPAFLLHADRMVQHEWLSPGKFDNRSMVFPQDFPSAQFLETHGIVRVLVVRHAIARPHEDLDHVLLRWQDSGIRLELKHPHALEPPVELIVRRPSRFRAFWYRALALVGLRRNSAGGFGSIIPESSGGG